MGYMTDGLTFNTLNGGNAERLKTATKFKKCKTWTLSQWFTALVGEVGEAANLVKKVDRGDFSLDSIRVELGKELADIQIYLDLLAQKAGVNLGQVTMDKFNEVSKRVGSNVFLDAGDWYYRGDNE